MPLLVLPALCSAVELSPLPHMRRRSLCLPAQDGCGWQSLTASQSASIQLSLCILYETSRPRGGTGEGAPGAEGTQGRGSDRFLASSLASSLSAAHGVELDRASSLQDAEPVVKVTYL